jgi:hypothetical protein
MSKTEPQLLGYTRSSKPIFAPTRGAPDTNNIVTYKKTRAKFAGWERGDHIDASILYRELSERTADKKLAWRYARWGGVHWDIGGRWNQDESRFGGTRT